MLSGRLGRWYGHSLNSPKHQRPPVSPQLRTEATAVHPVFKFSGLRPFSTMADVVKLAWYVYLKKLKNDPVRTKVRSTPRRALNRRHDPPAVPAFTF